jgi:hypothetical protein
MSAVWATRNDRQRAYLRALYACDQATEASGASAARVAFTTARRPSNGAGKCTAPSRRQRWSKPPQWQA